MPQSYRLLVDMLTPRVADLCAIIVACRLWHRTGTLTTMDDSYANASAFSLADRLQNRRTSTDLIGQRRQT